MSFANDPNGELDIRFVLGLGRTITDERLLQEWEQEFTALHNYLKLRNGRAGMVAAASCAIASSALFKATPDASMPSDQALRALESYLLWVAETFPDKMIYLPVIVSRLILRYEQEHSTAL